MNSDGSNSTLSDGKKSNQKSKSKGQHKNPREDKRKPDERRWRMEVTWKPLPDQVVQCPTVSLEAKVVYWYLWTLLPCHASIRTLVKILALRDNNQAQRAIKELLARKLLFYKIPPRGSRKVIFGMNLNTGSWDLASSTGTLIGPERKRGTWKNLRSDCANKKKILLAQSEQKNGVLLAQSEQNQNLRSDCANKNDHYYDSIYKDDSPFIDSTASSEAAGEPALGPFEGGQASPYESQNQKPPTRHVGPVSGEEASQRISDILSQLPPEKPTTRSLTLEVLQ